MSHEQWRWLSEAVILAVHDEQLAEHGGGAGVRDAGLLSSALARPVQLAHYGKPDVADLAAAYAYGIARNHPFVDGNKRTAFVAAGLFLALQGHRLVADDAEKVLTMLALAAGSLNEEQLGNWLRQHIAPRHAVHEPRKPYKR
jgi:death on curing protein